VKINVEKLKTDREYWDSVAPEGAEALIDKALFLKWVGDTELQYHRGEWRESAHSWSLQRYKDKGYHDVVERPSPSWDGSGLPQVGVVCEIAMISAPVKIVAHVREGGDTLAVYQCLKEEDWGAHSANKFRPLKTEKERVVEAVIKALGFEGTDYTDTQMYGTLCNAYDAGALKMPGDD